MFCLRYAIIFAVLAIGGTYAELDSREFPESFRFGTATASYQVEGAWNVSDKSESVWDRFTHSQNRKIKDRTTGDVACDSYHQYKRDVEMLVELGVDFYRFSISWTRFMPKGFGTEVSVDGVRYYNALIDELLKYNITPMVSLFHWDTPQYLQDLGGWSNPLMVDYFEDYALAAFANFGDRVKEWVTFSEPYNMCLYGYGSGPGAFMVYAPNLQLHGVATYLCGHYVLLAHARAYHLYRNTFWEKQRGRVGIVSIVPWAEAESTSAEDIEIANKAMQFNTGWFLHPILGKGGDYPEVMRKEVDAQSKIQGLRRSRLPTFTPYEVEYLKGTADFLGMNYYTAMVYANKGGKRPEEFVPSHENDLGHLFYQKKEWAKGASEWLRLRPTGLRDMLNWAYNEYNHTEILLTEVGFSSKGGLDDDDRVDFFNTHLEQVLKAIHDDHVNVTAFTTWSLMDNFEWCNGYTESFGLYEVDFSSPQRTRSPRASALVYRLITENHKLDSNYLKQVYDNGEKVKPKPKLWKARKSVLLDILMNHIFCDHCHI